MPTVGLRVGTLTQATLVASGSQLDWVQRDRPFLLITAAAGLGIALVYAGVSRRLRDRGQAKRARSARLQAAALGAFSAFVLVRVLWLHG